MRILLAGYGNMGREIEKILVSRGHTVAGIVDPVNSNEKELNLSLLDKADVVIDFSTPSSVEKNCSIYTKGKTAVVMGTTGWEIIRDKVKQDVEKSGIGFVWGSNFSVGAHMFFKLVEKAAELINPLPEYDIMLHEFHHKRKKDSPSGTALTTAERILKKNKQKTEIVTQALDRQIKENELHVSSTRGGEIPGIHKVILDSLFDTIEISHSARNRSGFALGAVLAAEWIVDKKGFKSVEELIKELFTGV